MSILPNQGEILLQSDHAMHDQANLHDLTGSIKSEQPSSEVIQKMGAFTSERGDSHQFTHSCNERLKKHNDEPATGRRNSEYLTDVKIIDSQTFDENEEVKDDQSKSEQMQLKEEYLSLKEEHEKLQKENGKLREQIEELKQNNELKPQIKCSFLFNPNSDCGS